MSPEPDAPPSPVRSRALREADGPAVVRLLGTGFPDRTEAYWTTAIARLFHHAATAEPAVPPGFVLEAAGELVGVILLIVGGTPAEPRVNLSSWTVDPRFVAYAPLLANQAVRREHLTYVNLSAASHTWPTIEAQGFSRYGEGRILALPALMAGRPGVRVRRFDPGHHAALSAWERDLLARHVSYGCLALVAEGAGELHPFVFLPWRIKHWMPAAQLVWCRAIEDFVRVGGPVGRHLLRLGVPAVLVDACGPVDGLPGPRIPDRSPKYAKGPARPRTGDLADTEIVMFGP